MARQSSTISVSCILVNWNGLKHTRECIDALLRSSYPVTDILVVDNGSQDGSVAALQASYPGVTVVESNTNLGFAGGNNLGIRRALQQQADYIWLLNNDTLPEPTALSALVSKMEANTRLGAVASICYYADAPERVQVWAGAYVNLWVGYATNSVIPRGDSWFDALYGASMLVRTAAIRQCGLLDEGFFHYWEETEFCLRLREQGWQLGAAPDSKVLHKVGMSTGLRNPILDRYFTASGLRILRLHSEVPWFSMPIFVSVRLARRLARLQFDRCRQVLHGVADYHRSSPLPKNGMWEPDRR